VELYDNYLKICHLAIQHAKKEQAFRLLEVLDEKAQTNGHQYLYLQVCDYYLEFYSKYDMEQYAQKCKEYVQIEEAYSEIVKDFKIKSMKNTESLRETEREKERYVKKSRLDLATGLLNKAAWENEVREYMQVRDAGSLDAMIMLDLDDFKSVNDKYGHMTGDGVLCRLADVIKANFSTGGILGRFGGDEFVILATNVNSIRQLEEKLLDAKNIFSEFSLGKNKECKPTVSIGVSWTKETFTSMETMFEYADKALYQAKSGGKNSIRILEIKDTL
jgi:diguanylate cyclase (GGDEF)-like protein